MADVWSQSQGNSEKNNWRSVEISETVRIEFFTEMFQRFREKFCKKVTKCS